MQFFVRGRSQQTGIRIGTASRKAKAPKKAKPPPRPKPPKKDRQKKKNCHQAAYKAWLKTMTKDPGTGEYHWVPGVNDTWLDFQRRYNANHPECR